MGPPPGFRRSKGGKALTALLIQVLDGTRVQGALALIDDAPMSRGTGLGAAVAALAALRECPPPGAWGPEVLRGSSRSASSSASDSRWAGSGRVSRP